jgi:cytochrome b
MTDKIKVWDPLVRIFHWALVLTFFISYLTGDEESDIHIYAGYAVLGLISFRLIWGVVGTKYARFYNFITSPTNTMAYIKSMANKPKRYIGHNPAGAWMIVVMLVTLFIVTLSGLEIYAIEEGKGPFAGSPSISIISNAHADDDEHEEEESFWEEFWEEIHEASSNFMLLLIALHIIGVFVSGRLHKENLVRAMITGEKKADP